MYIKEVIIDGFKSYAQRTEITGFDPLFNAITGLNGSGKSNILDAICFLLGITDMSQVRAANLQELVYKNGQAGISKATVTVTFNNRDKSQSPVGYENYDEITVHRQVVIGGKNKYLLNGVTVNNKRVQDLFLSVQLNVNNPHFLIMQGRITKVLNMKPPEILSMVEEAAGTRLYESKKKNSLITIEKKEKKLAEVDKILNEDIKPKLQKLSADRSSYLEYQKVVRELQHLTKLYTAYQFLRAEKTKERSAHDQEALEGEVRAAREREAQIDTEVGAVEEEVDRLTRQRDEEMGGVIKQHEGELAKKQKEEATARSNLNAKKDLLKTENKEKKDVGKLRENVIATRTAREKDLAAAERALAALQDTSEQDERALEAAKQHHHAVSAGLSAAEGGGPAATLNDQLIAAKATMTEAQTAVQTATIKLQHAQKELKTKTNEAKNTESGYAKDRREKEQLSGEVKRLTQRLGQLDYTEGRQEALQTRRRDLQQRAAQCRHRVEDLQHRSGLNFSYSDPEPGFDRRAVKGLVAELFDVTDPQNAIALEVAAGGRLNNVVVDNERTAKKLLERGRLPQRCTFIPLDKIQSSSIPQNVLQRGQSLVGRNAVYTALSLIEYDRSLQTAMQFVFGSTLVCRDMTGARKLAFDSSVSRTSVTLEGDIVRPGGTMTGGTRKSEARTLRLAAELREGKAELARLEGELAAVERELREIQGAAARWEETKQQLEEKSNELTLLQERLQQTTHHQLVEEADRLRQEIAEQEKVLADAKQVQATHGKKVKELENKLKNSKKLREQELKDAEKQVQTLKDKLQSSGKKTSAKKQEHESLRLEIDELTQKIATYDDQLVNIDRTIAALQQEIDKLAEAAEQTKAEVQEAQERLTKHKDGLRELSNEIKTHAQKHKALKTERGQIELRIIELEQKKTKSVAESKDAAKTVESMLRKHDWIAEERKYFGQPHTAFDFSEIDPKEAGSKIHKLEEKEREMKKHVNMSVIAMLSTAQEQYDKLVEKREIVLKDKEHIQRAIAQLDIKKNNALEEAYLKVNKSFGSIFSMLLPGTQAKLVPQEGRSVLDGLEVKVAFGDVWKESLQELSGGQRSLVALSLILSLLLFKPAPIYILDEVDAALDLAHTQNVGTMIRTHFTKSQFIVVSLKDGMFNNANVLFKTKFVNGVSTVSRYTQHQTERRALAPQTGENEASKKRKKTTS